MKFYRPSWWSFKRSAQFLLGFYILMICITYWRGGFNNNGYKYHNEIIRLSAHLNRGSARIIRESSVAKGSAAWLGNGVESVDPQTKMFDLYKKSLNKDGWILLDDKNGELIFCKGEIRLTVNYEGVSTQLNGGELLNKYSEDYQWPDREGYCPKGH